MASLLSHTQGESSTSFPPSDDAMFALEGFDADSFDEGRGMEREDVTDGAGVAFPQSDDEEISTDGEGGEGWRLIEKECGLLVFCS